MVKVFIITGLIFPVAVFAYFNPGSPAGFVNDFSGILSIEERGILENKLQQFEKDSSNEITVAIISSLQGDTIENFSVKLFEEWKIGKKNNDNGILLLIAQDDRQVRIEVGYGLEGALTDAQSFQIIQKIIAPAFQAGEYFMGINGSVDAISAATRGEYTVLENVSSSPKFSSNVIFWGIALLFWVIEIIVHLLGRSKSWWLGGVLGGLTGLLLSFWLGFIYFGLLAILGLGGLGLGVDYFISKNYNQWHKGGSRRFWWFGGGGSGFGGGGFGGFGGGRSGGGGASGRW
ncbi:MAG: hypothetical protein A3J53_00460 [Candidatus Harrisonbacteria bacterium RIFCSPHIGHO2_02_FULL_40_20]|nr:MAG: hypothetical protein A3J53_00460 [Candidatus Harrisonbacteria bacterium RIFCSPHIGHO2_02_FULL_40_20]